MFRVGLSFTSSPYQTSVLALRSSTDFLKVWNTANLHHSRVLFFLQFSVLWPCLHMHRFTFLRCVILKKSVYRLWPFISPGGKPFHWEFVHGLLESAIYGGHIDNPFDLRILRSYLEQFFSVQLLSSSSAAQRRSRGEASCFTPPISLPHSCILTVGGIKLHLHS